MEVTNGLSSEGTEAAVGARVLGKADDNDLGGGISGMKLAIVTYWLGC